MAINVSVQYNGGFLPRHGFLTRHDTVDLMLLPLGNPIKCHEEVLSLQHMGPPIRFDIVWSSHKARLWINRVRLPILLMVS